MGRFMVGRLIQRRCRLRGSRVRFGGRLGPPWVRLQGEVAKGFEDVKGGELERGVINLGGVKIGGEGGSGFLSGAGLFKPSLFEEPVLVAAFFPLGEVGGFEILAMFAEPLDDVGVGNAV